MRLLSLIPCLSVVMVLVAGSAIGEELMSETPSKAEIRHALRPSTSYSAKPAAGSIAIHGVNQGLAIANRTDPKGSAAFPSIRFKRNSAELTEAARSTLNTLASVLLEPDFAHSKLVIEGHTDASGSAAHNQALSQRRAEAVVQYLAEQGVPRSQLTPQGRGETELYDSANPNWAVNRRVVVVNRGV